jgi:2-polyprenyl-6-methoxyphenol hydroxylase-like FAD-dependent oxidoreductase
MGMIEYPNLQRSVSKPGLALIGDAALSSDPLWGVGCGWALQSAEWLAGSVGRAWTSPSDLDRGLSAYAKRHRSQLAGHQFLIGDFSNGRPFNFIERLMFSAAARDPVCRYFRCIRKPLYRREPISPPRCVGARRVGERSPCARRHAQATKPDPLSRHVRTLVPPGILF